MEVSLSSFCIVMSTSAGADIDQDRKGPTRTKDIFRTNAGDELILDGFAGNPLNLRGRLAALCESRGEFTPVVRVLCELQIASFRQGIDKVPRRLLRNAEF